VKRAQDKRNEMFRGIAEKSHLMGVGKELMDDIKKGWNVEDVLAYQEQRKVAKYNQEVGRRFMKGGLGEVKMSITPKFYHDMIALYGPRIWQDKAFRDSVFKKNPEVRVKNHSDKTIIPVNGLKRSQDDRKQAQVGLKDQAPIVKPEARGGRFHKNYGVCELGVKK
jgi:hypothetical protein